METGRRKKAVNGASVARMGLIVKRLMDLLCPIPHLGSLFVDCRSEALPSLGVAESIILYIAIHANLCLTADLIFDFSWLWIQLLLPLSACQDYGACINRSESYGPDV